MLGWLEIEAEDMVAAREHLVDSLRRAQELGDSLGTSEALAVGALWCARQQRYEHAVRLYAASDQIADGLIEAKASNARRIRFEADGKRVRVMPIDDDETQQQAKTARSKQAAAS